MIPRKDADTVLLVTGASGLLGANFLFSARDRCLEVIALTYRHRISLQGVRSVQTDLTNIATAREVLWQFKPTWIVHFAALTDVDRCEESPLETDLVNVQMTRNLASEGRKIGARMVYVSTDSVFSGEIGDYAEDDVPAPLNLYAQSKLNGETAVLGHLPDSLIIRTNFYGWNAQDKLSLAEWIVSRLNCGQPVAGLTDVMFTPILANHLSDIILDIMGKSLQGIYHVAGSESCSKYQFALDVAEVFGCDKNLVRPVCVSDIGFRAPRPRNPTLRTQKVRKALGTKLPDVRSGLEHFKSLRDTGFVSKLKGLLRPFS